jgi:hypothetical protein
MGAGFVGGFGIVDTDTGRLHSLTDYYAYLMSIPFMSVREHYMVFCGRVIFSLFEVWMV